MNVIEKFLDHQIGYVYLSVSNELQANQAAILAAVPTVAGQVVSALQAAVKQVLGHSGPVGALVATLVDQAIAELAASEGPALQNDAAKLLGAVIAKLQAHAKEMLAA